MSTKKLSGWGELFEAQNRWYEAETERIRVTQKTMKLFVCCVNVKKTVDIRPGEQAIILMAENAADAENKVRQSMCDNQGKSVGWPIQVTEADAVFCETKNVRVAPHYTTFTKAAAAGK